MPNKYRLKSFEIEAMQWDGTQEGATPIIDWVVWLEQSGEADWACYSPENFEEAFEPVTA